MKSSSAESFRKSINDIMEFVSKEDNKQQLSEVAKKYKKDKSKFDWLFTQAIKKVSGYTSKMNDDECERSRKVLLDLIIAII